ncbi:DUF72 domain-containing protein [Mesorhizobium sp. BR1-1-16]|uniref:DUF72 domain-containing protein n=1 Tax=Mesorhizobium sp. BR1-1-16 TaxID=2876653 RepID=UPI001CCFCECA|nr:DUF72 domain-containing protein [Mesorhizobium sp. BR1-1-16]MBZ9938869.1 DUF72 domain-containing protein [Mesorhizobium sp. BR1-1-16]
MKRQGRIRIGVSGWTYAPWRGHFYPEGLAHKNELAFAADAFPSIEINGTFYRLQRPETFQRWAEETPDDFVFSVKGPRYITHMRRLREPEAPLANFFASGVLQLGGKLGPVLWQFPASFDFDAERLDAFLAQLPHDAEAALAIAKKHDARLSGIELPHHVEPHRIRHAVEIRHDSFRNAEFIALLRHRKVALVCADTVEWPRLMDLTADFAYLRLHGSEELYRSGYTDDALDRWARLVRAFAYGKKADDADLAGPPDPHPAPRDVYAYFDNTDKRHAPDDARTLIRKLGLATDGEGPGVDAEPGQARRRQP